MRRVNENEIDAFSIARKNQHSHVKISRVFYLPDVYEVYQRGESMDEIFVNRMYRFETKEVVEYTKSHNAGRYVALTAEAKSLIETAKRYQQEHSMCDSGYIFSVNEEPLSYYAIRKLYERYCKEIGTVNKSSHKSRKTYISALIDGGVNINAIRELVGHADERTTYNSYCYDRKTKSERVTMIENALSGKVCNQKAKSVIIFSASEYTLITNLQPSKNAEIPTEKENGSDFSLP